MRILLIVILLCTCTVTYSQENEGVFFDINNGSKYYKELAGFIASETGCYKNSDIPDFIRCVSLIDTILADTSGIFSFSFNQYPSNGVFVFKKYPNSEKLFILSDYGDKCMYKFFRRFFRKVKCDSKRKTAFLYRLAEFYNDYVFIKEVGANS